jgi:peptidoglycan LD-endopeptidase LytH
MRRAALVVTTCSLAWVGLLVWVGSALDEMWLFELEAPGAAGESVWEPIAGAPAPAADRSSRRASRLFASQPGAGVLMMPVEGVEPQQIQDTFGDPRGHGRRHEGIDILAPRHTPVLAADDGLVKRLFESNLGGISLYKVDPSGRYCYYYAHLQGYARGIEEGLVVRRGDHLGYVGTTGNAPETVPHLHFGVYRLPPGERCSAGMLGEPLDPLPLLLGP